MRQIHTLGDLGQLVPHRVNKRCFLMLQNLIYVEKSEYMGRRGGGGDWRAMLRGDEEGHWIVAVNCR